MNGTALPTSPIPTATATERFAVEVQWVNGRTQLLPGTFARIALAEKKVKRVTEGIDAGRTPGWRQAYVVVGDGSAV